MHIFISVPVLLAALNAPASRVPASWRHCSAHSIQPAGSPYVAIQNASRGLQHKVRHDREQALGHPGGVPPGGRPFRGLLSLPAQINQLGRRGAPAVLNVISPGLSASERPKSIAGQAAGFASLIAFQMSRGVPPRFWKRVSEQPYL